MKSIYLFMGIVLSIVLVTPFVSAATLTAAEASLRPAMQNLLSTIVVGISEGKVRGGLVGDKTGSALLAQASVEGCSVTSIVTSREEKSHIATIYFGDQCGSISYDITELRLKEF